MGYGNFTINGVSIKNPTTFKIERYNVTNLERIADASIVGDLIAKKVKLYFTYDAIGAGDLDRILDLIWETNSLFYTVRYRENGSWKSVVCYVGSIPTELHRGGRTTNWVWKNVTFNLIER